MPMLTYPTNGTSPRLLDPTELTFHQTDVTNSYDPAYNERKVEFCREKVDHEQVTEICIAFPVQMLNANLENKHTNFAC